MPFVPRLESGKLRHRIDILNAVTGQDSMGGQTAGAGSTFATVWASVEALSAREIFAAQQITAQVSHKVTIRWLDGVKAKMAVSFDGRAFDIVGVQNPDGRHKMLILLCLERNDGD